MTLERVLARLGLALLAGLTILMIVQLVQRAERGAAARAAILAAGNATSDPLSGAATSRLLIHFDRSVVPSCVRSGWSQPEPGSGLWSTGHLAILDLPTLPSAQSAELALTLEAFIAPGLPVQTVRLRAGGRPLAEWRLTSSSPTTVRVMLPSDIPAAAGRIELQFDLPNADAPARRIPGSADRRSLGVKLKTLEITG